MTGPHFNAWKRVADEAIRQAGLDEELKFLSVGSRKNDPGYLEIAVKGTDPSFGSIAVAIQGGGTRMPTESDVDEVAVAIREKWDEVSA